MCLGRITERVTLVHVNLDGSRGDDLEELVRCMEKVFAGGDEIEKHRAREVE